MASEKKQITRSRASLSCQTCRRRKVKCTKEHPICSTCKRSGEACLYGDSDRPLTAAEQIATESDNPRKRRAEGTHNDINGQANHPSEFTLRAIDERLNQLDSVLNEIGKLTSVSISKFPDVQSTGDVIPVQPFYNGTFDADLHLENIGTRTADVSKPWLEVLGKFDQLNILLRRNIGTASENISDITIPQDEQSRGRAITSRFGLSSRDRGKGAVHNILPSDVNYDVDEPENDIIAPTDEESNALFRSWLWSCYPIFPLIPAGLVLQKYQAFNHWYKHDMDKAEPNPDPSFMPFLCLIWITGYNGLTRKGREKWFPWAVGQPMYIKNLRALLERYLEAMKSDISPSIWTLAASIIAHHLAIDGQGLVANHLRNTLNLRAAQSLGFHSERLLRDTKRAEAETKRRIWWEVVSLDASVATVSGAPNMLDECYTDTDAISELKDCFLGTDDATEYEKHLQQPSSRPDSPDDPANNQTSSFVSVFYMVMKARHILTAATKKILRANMRAQPMSIVELKELRASLYDAGKQVHKIVQRIPTRGIPEQDFMPKAVRSAADLDHHDSVGSAITEHEIKYFLRETSDRQDSMCVEPQHRATIIAFHKWARITLSMMVDRLDCISYAPFLKNSKSRLWAVARNCALRSCHGFMRRFLTLAKDPELRRFRWAWPTMYQPVHAIMILLIDLHDRPHSEEAPRSRAMIDDMFSHSSPEKDLIDFQHWPKTALPLKEGGEEAWAMLRKLRHKAWHKAGLDPDVLWSEEDQMAVGIGKPLTQNELFIRSLREDIILDHRQRNNIGEQVPTPTASHLLKDHIQNARKQHLHPSELGPGDRVSGPLIRDVEDLDESMPQILHLRASHEQELMPFPLAAEMPHAQLHPCTSSREAAFKAGTSFTGKENSAEVHHIGDLIKKIRNAQGATTLGEKIDTMPNRSKQSSWLHSPNPSSQQDEQVTICNFRTVTKVMNAAYQDLQDKQEKSDVCPQYGDNDISVTSRDDPSSFVQYPLLSTPSFHDSNNYRTGDQLYQELFNNSGTLTTVASIPPASIPPASHSPGPNRPAASSRVEAGTGNSFKETSQRESELIEHNLSARTGTADPHHDLPKGNDMDVAATSAVNITTSDTGMDFDWDRWDELFGHLQFAGFEDMMVEMSEEAHATGLTNQVLAKYSG